MRLRTLTPGHPERPSGLIVLLAGPHPDTRPPLLLVLTLAGRQFPSTSIGCRLIVSWMVIPMLQEVECVAEHLFDVLRLSNQQS